MSNQSANKADVFKRLASSGIDADLLLGKLVNLPRSSQHPSFCHASSADCAITDIKEFELVANETLFRVCVEVRCLCGWVENCTIYCDAPARSQKTSRFVGGSLDRQAVRADLRHESYLVALVAQGNDHYERREGGNFHLISAEEFHARIPCERNQPTAEQPLFGAGTTLTKQGPSLSDVQKLASLLSRIDEHLDCRGLTLTKRWQRETLQLRGEIVAAIRELQAQATTGDSDVAALQESAGDAPQATDAEVGSPHGNYVGVCGVKDCPHCKTQAATEPELPQTWRDRAPML